MPAWPDKWDGLETFEEALRTWACADLPPTEVVTATERWINSRQDNPYDSDAVPDDSSEDVRTVRAWVRDLYLRPVLCGDEHVVCFYEINEMDHRLNCLYFTTRQGVIPPD